MRDADDGNEPGVVRSAREALELRSRIVAMTRVTQDLEQERLALAEVRAGLVGDIEGLTQRVSAVDAQCQELRKALDEVQARVTAIEGEAAAMKSEAAALDARLFSARRRSERLASEHRQLEVELQQRRRQLADAQAVLGRLSGSMLRMDYKLRRETD